MLRRGRSSVGGGGYFFVVRVTIVSYYEDKEPRQQCTNVPTVRSNNGNGRATNPNFVSTDHRRACFAEIRSGCLADAPRECARVTHARVSVRET